MLAPNVSLYKLEVHAEQKVKRFSSPFALLRLLLFPNLGMTKQRHRQEQISCARSPNLPNASTLTTSAIKIVTTAC